jgi:hypothetical protein
VRLDVHGFRRTPITAKENGTMPQFSRACALSGTAVALLLLAAGPAFAVDLYFNSYGWDKVYRMDTDTSQIDLIPPRDILETTFFSAADFARDGRLYGIGAAGSLVAVDVSGAQTAWTELYPVADGGDAIGFTPADELWVVNGATLRQVAAGGATVPGSTVDVTYLGSAAYLSGIDFTADGTLYAADSGNLFRLDPQTGAATWVHSRPDLSGGIFTDITVAADGIIHILGSFNYLYEYDPQTGAGGWVPGELLYEGSSFSPSSLASPVPEPASLALLGVATVFVCSRIMQRRKRGR